MGGSSWLTAVKRAFRSPTKDAQKKTARRTREHNDQELDEDERKREKRRWLFRKHSATAPPPPPTKSSAPVVLHPTPRDHRHAIAMAAATAAAAEAAVATAQAAVEIIRLTRSSNPPNNINPSSIKQNYAAIMIQKAFRGYLARRALVALRGIVKLQALIRGQNVRKQAKMTLRCMQALLRLQTRMHPSRLSQDGGSRKSMFAENTNSFFWDNNSKQIPENIRERRSMSRDRRGSNSSIDWNWNDCPRTLQELEECLQSRKEAALRRESSSSSSLAQKTWNAENEMNGEGTNWLEQWMETKQWRDEQQQQQQQHYYRENNRVSTDRRDSFVKTVEMDNNSTPKRRAHSAATCPSPSRSSIKAPSTPSSKMRTPPPSSQSYSHSAANTPSLRSVQRLSSSISRNTAPPAVPNYMAATESARARIRSQSAPRQRPSTPERDRCSGGGGGAGMMAKKRLSFPVPPPVNGSYSQSLRSPSFKSVQAGYVGMEQQSNQSCYTDSIGGEISPCSTTELRWWLRT